MVLQRPVIGVIGCGRTVEGEPAQAVKYRYLEAVERFADAVPLIIPSNQSADNVAGLVARLDAVLLTGSNSNVDPQRYRSGAPAQAPVDAARDGFSAALIHAAINAGKPLFGVCRGLQEINVAMGGTLRDMRGADGTAAHHAPSEASLDESFAWGHDILVVGGSLLHRVTQANSLRVNSVHFQTIDHLADGLVINARAGDGVVEAVSAPHTAAPVFAVQWHPEWRPEGRPHDVAFWHFLGEAARAHYVPARGSELTA